MLRKHHIKSKMNFLIWGTGERGKRISFHIGYNNIIAFIDDDVNKIGEKFLNISIISYDEYKNKYLDTILVLTTHEDEIISQLNKDGISSFLCMSKCPEDFQSPYTRNILKNALIKTINTNEKYLIFGESLYSILLLGWLRELSLDHEPYLLVSPNISRQLLNILRKNFGKKILTDVDDLLYVPDKIYVTENFLENKLPENLRSRTENLLRFSENIDEYYNPGLERFKNIHFGKRCFIVATGSSLQIKDLEILKEHGEICISMNKIFKIFDETTWRPDYYVAQDFRMMKNYEEEILALDVKGVFISDGYAPFIEKVKNKHNIYINHMGVVWDTSEDVPFSEDISRICYISGTVAYSCFQIAAYMGFTEIYLLGIDFSGKDKEWEKYTHCHDLKNHNMSYFGNQFEHSYESAKKYANSHGIKIFNAGRHSSLSVFPKIDFDSLFQDDHKIQALNLLNKNVRISYECSIKNVEFGEYANVAHHAQISDSSIGKRTSIGRYTKIRETIVGKYCSISWDVTVGAVTHPFNHISSHAFTYRKQFGICDEDYNIPQKQTIIGNDVWIGCNSVILSGIKIGDGAIVGAGSVVTKDVEPYSIVAGAPAHFIKYRFDKEYIKRLLQLKWWEFSDEDLKKNQFLFTQNLDENILNYLEKSCNNGGE